MEFVRFKSKNQVQSFVDINDDTPLILRDAFLSKFKDFGAIKKFQFTGLSEPQCFVVEVGF
ncbi:hypothetical protein [Solidesulfovibrio sp.]